MHDNETERLALERISVTHPYYDLADLETVDGGAITATVPHRPPRGGEAGTVEAAQVARHLAILGSCAAALGRDDDTKHHYLATSAHFERVDGAPDQIEGPLLGWASATWSDRRSARAVATLAGRSGEALNVLEVDYAVLSPRMFDRLNPPIDSGDDVSGVADETLAWDPEPLIEGRRVRCGRIPASMCAGHFPDRPAAPVALVMGLLCRAAGEAMLDHVGSTGARYRIEQGDVTATRLAQATQRLTLEASYDAEVARGHRIRGSAIADDVVVGEVDVVMSIQPADLASGDAVTAGSSAA